MTFHAYDQYGNVLQQTGLDGKPVSYLWGYRHCYPVAVLEGVQYSEVPASYKNNSAVVNPAGDAPLQTLLEGLRTALPSDRTVTTYTYKPQVGMSRQADANGLTTYYEYDGIGRLHLQKDSDGKLAHRYEYRMKGPAQPWASTMLYANIPLMRSYTREISPGVRQFYNRSVPGGKYITTYGQATAEMAAREEGNWYEPVLHPPEVPPVPTSGMAAVRLYQYLGFSTGFGDPDLLSIDFIQDGSIVASQRFSSSSLHPDYATIYLPPGEYRVSMRTNADVNYQGGCPHFIFYGGQPPYQYGSNDFVKTGTSFVLQAGETYDGEVFIKFAY
ncbi:hypothetical protein [Sphingobacterium olei]|uniref:hypothetical protein n=1 Tax=Sphingobacterium olei TaxID=2571155 RepID=UPI00138FCA8C|nr:hypothetical protein [Sphingobacterium olei]